jgi:bifunctional DNA-binding transcriptional regulator/antitoxin component of YhaV-PrlF toxin-antitoxin module
MTEIIFKDNSIQSGYRIKIPKPIVDTLNLKQGQKIKLRFDADKKLIIVEEDLNGGKENGKKR